jgi:hydrogenase nickel incorporation protein HypA/HybF
MHERALMRNLVERIVGVAEEENARVSRISVRLGALSHFTPEHFLEHFEDAARGTAAEGAEVDATMDADVAHEHARDVVLETVEVES